MVTGGCVSPHRCPRRSISEPRRSWPSPPATSAHQPRLGFPKWTGYPPPAQVLGVLLNSVFLDLLDQDALRLERLNRLIDQVPRSGRDGLRRVSLLILRPSVDLGHLASEFEPKLPRTFRFLTRGLGTRQTASSDLLSLVLFQPDYTHRLIELGETDAEARADEIEEFIVAEGSDD